VNTSCVGAALAAAALLSGGALAQSGVKLEPGVNAGVAAAQAFPNRPIRVVVPWAPGGINDTSARLLAQHMTASMGQPVVVDNRGGAASTIGTDIVAKSAPDGHTLLYTDLTATAVNAAAYPKLPYDTLKDLTPVTMVGVSPMFLVVHAAVPAKTVQEYVALAKAKPGTLNYASAGNGSTSHLVGEMLRIAAKIDIAHVPFKGSGPATISLVSGEVGMHFSASPPILPHIKSGALRALATTLPRRSSIMPEVPALAEIYPGVQIFILSGVVAPTGVPRERIAYLGAEIAKAAQLPEVQRRFEVLGLETRTSTPAALGAFVETEITRLGKLIRETGTKLD
jgi:tripartite-type tricarboxylate transporter receptor subunit TctC